MTSCIIPAQLIRIFLIGCLGAAMTTAQTSVVTAQNDIGRTGRNLAEAQLTPANVNPALFGKLFSVPVDGYVYAQPLYLPNLTIAGAGKHNVVFIATEHDSVYAFDADSNRGSNALPLWRITLLDAAHGAPSGATTVPSSTVNSGDIVPEIGITSTPVIDPASGTLYVVGKSLESGNAVQRLHALDVTSGAEKFGGPVTLQASVAGTGTGSVGGTLSFDPLWENNRTGLLLLNGIVYIGFAAHGDNGPWHGWILGYNAATLTQTGAYCATPNGYGSGVWMSGAGLAADVIDPVNAPFGRMFIATGNGTFDAVPPYASTMDFGDDEVRLDLTNGSPEPVDAFTPYNQDTLRGEDGDVGAGGVLLLPDQTSGGHTHLLVQAGKQGSIYLVDRDSMGGYSPSSDNIVQEITGQIGGMWSSPAFWHQNVYFWANGDSLKQFSLTKGKLSATPVAESAEYYGFPGATLSISANGASNGIVWSIETDAAQSSGPAVLQAHDATNVASTLYSSNVNPGRDSAGAAVKFSIPTIVNGKVYAAAEYAFSVYGLLNGMTQAETPVLNPGSELFPGSIQVKITDGTPGTSIYYTTDGSTPTQASTLYTTPITVSATTTINAIAAEAGYLDSGVASATYTLETQTSEPSISPAGGTYASTQTVILTKTMPGEVIYYTLDGSTPTTGSPKYKTALKISATTTVKALAIASGLSPSNVLTTVYAIAPGATVANFGAGFANAAARMTFNGSAVVSGSLAQLTNGQGNEAGSAFFNTRIGVSSFANDFTFQLVNPLADGITFTIQTDGPTALGPAGGDLGYGSGSGGSSILKSVAVKFDLYNNQGEGVDSTGIYTNGAAPTIPSIDMTGSGVDLHTGDIMAVHMTYNGTRLAMTVTDTVTNAVFTKSWPIDIASIVGSKKAYVGFTAGTGGETATQNILTWTYAALP
jgi:hypothetical protein